MTLPDSYPDKRRLTPSFENRRIARENSDDLRRLGYVWTADAERVLAEYFEELDLEDERK